MLGPRGNEQCHQLSHCHLSSVSALTLGRPEHWPDSFTRQVSSWVRDPFLVPNSVYQIHFLYPVPALVLANNLTLTTCYLL